MLAKGCEDKMAVTVLPCVMNNDGSVVLIFREMLATGCEDKMVRVFYMGTTNSQPIKVFSGRFPVSTPPFWVLSIIICNVLVNRFSVRV